jgi:lipopolysaccharide/colanic/teichoic acid biosynthesis glycosyltransferase
VTRLAERKRTGPPGPPRGQERAKRLIDISLSVALIITVTPLLLLLWCLVRWTSSGPAFFRQERVGRNMRSFTMLKLRTMYVDNHDQIHRNYVTHLLSAEKPIAAGEKGLFKLEQDPRVTPLGAWLRRTSLDELPQLFNVLRGEMSLVGPRPVLPWEAELFGERYRQRFLVKPGISGLWQVSGRSRLTMREALELDVDYVNRQSLALDLSIILRTVPTLFGGGAR